MGYITTLPCVFAGFFDFSEANSEWLISMIVITSISRGFRCLVSPGHQYRDFGIPREDWDLDEAGGGSMSLPETETETRNEQEKGDNAPVRDQNQGKISPLMYVRGIREIGFGLAVRVSVSSSSSSQALTALACVCMLMSLGDALVVRAYRSKTKPRMTVYHWGLALYFGLMWLWRRKYVAVKHC